MIQTHIASNYVSNVNKHLYNNFILIVNDEGEDEDVRSDKLELWNDTRISDLEFWVGLPFN